MKGDYMTETFNTIIEQKKASVIKVMEGLQELLGQPVLSGAPDEILRKCSSAELVYLIALNEQVKGLQSQTKSIVTAVFNPESRTDSLKHTLGVLGKLDDSKGGASLGW